VHDVARAIRASMPNGEIRLIAVTGYGQPTDRELALQAGFDTHEFNGSAANEIITLAAGGRDVILTRNIGNIVMTAVSLVVPPLGMATGLIQSAAESGVNLATGAVAAGTFRRGRSPEPS